MMAAAMSSIVLKGVRILDFSWVLAGPFATRLLADFGAEVIKIQPLLAEADDAYSRAYYNSWNRNKLGLSLDLSKPQGLEIVRRLVKISDAAVENFSPRVMTNWGLDYSAMRRIKADIILLSLSVMGHSGPQQNYSGFGPAVQAFAGLTYLTAYAENDPVGAGFAYSDHVAGLYGALALQGALEYRDRTGQGQHIDLSQTETMLSLLADSWIPQTGLEKGLSAHGNHSEAAAPQGVYPCRGEDRWCAITVASDQDWQNFKEALGWPEWAEDRRFATLTARLKNAKQLDQIIGGWTRRHWAEEAAAILQSAGIAAEVGKDTADLASDPHLKERGFFVRQHHSEEGDAVSEASPIRLSRTPAEYWRAAPRRGQDNHYVLGELLGMTEDQIEELKQDKVI
jgi:benzylsuccinate CoA-transferase BbsF subunit